MFKLLKILFVEQLELDTMCNVWSFLSCCNRWASTFNGRFSIEI